MRIFVALELPEDVLLRIREWKEPLRKRYPSLKWVSDRNMHLTLRFFGDIGEDALAAVSGAMEGWKPGPMQFQLGKLGTFGRRSSPSVYWLGGDFPNEISRMAGRLGRIPDDRGRVSEKEFVPHLTVARRREGAAPVLEPPNAMNGVITAASIIDSRLTSEGPEYTYLRKFDLHQI